MPGTRTAPTVATGDLLVRIGFRLIDSRGDIRTASVDAVGIDPSGPIFYGQVETIAAALQAATNASLFEVAWTTRFVGARDASNALDAVVESVYDNIAVNYKAVDINLQQSVFVPAPIGDLILDGDIVDNTDTVYTDFRDAVAAFITGGTGAPAYTPVSVRFTERREKNDSTPA